MRYMRKIENLLVKKLIIHAPVLDVGCGVGRHLKLLIKKQLRCIGIDISLKSIKIAKKEMLNEYLKKPVDFLAACSDFLPMRDTCINALISIFGAYNHSSDKGIAEILRVLKKGGAGLITIANKLRVAKWLEAIIHRKPKRIVKDLRHPHRFLKVKTKKGKIDLWIRFFTPRELKRVFLEKSGGKILLKIGGLLIFTPGIYFKASVKHSKIYNTLFKIENKVRWLPPFNYFGEYIILKFEKLE